MQEGAFDEAVKGVDAILHTASPIGFGFDDPQGISQAFIAVCCVMCD
jgi:hypothetical protein